MAIPSSPKRILIVGNLGYIGPVLTQHLRSTFPNAELIGYDTGFFEHNLLQPISPAHAPHTQHYGDIRTLDPAILTGIDSIIALAAISNDPMGDRYEAPTMQINAHSIIALASLAKAQGVRSFVFASSCSVYGTGSTTAVTEQTELVPLTAYARSKAACEAGLSPLADEQFTVTCLRFATACGLSPRLRLDLVLNDFVASAHLHRRIDILSDGTPWRPLIDVTDMSRAMAWGITRPASNGGAYLVVNTGANSWNYTVAELAQRAATQCGTDVSVHINPQAAPDKRSYKVDFSLFQTLAPDHQPLKTIDDTIAELLSGLKAAAFADKQFRQGPLIRLQALQTWMDKKQLNANLEWQTAKPFSAAT